MCIEIKKYLYQLLAYVCLIAAGAYPVPPHTHATTQDAVKRLTELAAIMNQLSTPEANKVTELAENASEDVTHNYWEIEKRAAESAKR